ncbi:dynamin family protein [Actinophytocola sp.]|uniref:dynamin family protein n=1 Tax=Actinophytocola sp. TaxID=1872138 RepID=UPI002D296FBE|nr:dynamin family protein [Actinophytocola sp.]HYQ68529.1 dynamin family protein [Actinophytocola sp.]
MTSDAAAALDRAVAAIARYDRPDLDARLRQAGERLLADDVRVLVVGEFKQGKSMLVNGIACAPVCPVQDDIATAVPTEVRYADPAAVTLVGKDGARTEIPLDQLARYACEPSTHDGHVEVGVPRAVLRGGLVLVDTPGVGGLNSVHGAATRSALATADAVLFVTDASQELTAPEVDFLRQATDVCPTVACVLTKTDLYPEWRRIWAGNREHLGEIPLFPVSSTMRWHALTTGDTELSQESGFPPLVRHLRDEVLGRSAELARRSTAHDVNAVTDQLLGQLRAERAAQDNPADVLRDLTAAEARATALKERSARWQQTLNDGVADLNADIDYDLRDRLREIVRAAEESITAGGDPSRTWEQFAQWVRQSAVAAASANYLWATQRARSLARRVAEHFDEERAHALPVLEIQQAGGLDAVRDMTIGDAESWTVGRRLLVGVKGGYSGLLMFGMFGSLVGFALLNPVSIGAAVLLGRRGIGDERKRIVTKRQNEARTSLRRYIDDVTFHVGKDSRDMLRGVQRVLRDHFTARAEEMKRSLQESLKAAEKAAKASKAERDRRLAELDARIRELETVRGLL